MKIGVSLRRGGYSHIDLINQLSEKGAFDRADWDQITFRLEKGCFIQTASIAFLAAWGLHIQAQGKVIQFDGPKKELNYLSRIDLFQLLGFEYEDNFERHEEEGRFLPIKTISDFEDVLEATDSLCELVLQQMDNAHDFLPAFEWTVNEIIDNIRNHSFTKTPGVVCAQYYPKRGRIDIGICDMGQGIKESLGKSIQLWGHGHAITTALQRGVTRDPEIGQGNGMAGSYEIIRINGKGAEMDIWSGDANYQSRDGKDGDFQQIPEIPGTGVLLRFNTKRVVRLDETFIGERWDDWSYINAISERLEEEGMDIASEVRHTLGRETARPLRRKIIAILPEMLEPLVLDFRDVKKATSSFFDELLGRLAKEIGKEEFYSKIQIHNLEQSLQDMANVVIHQRLEEGV